MLWETVTKSPSELAAEFYDVFYGSRQDTDFFLSIAKELGGPILEVGCGTGRILVPIAESGCTITGIDISADNLDVCRQRLEMSALTHSIQANLVQADMREFNLNQSYQLAIFPFRTLQELLTTEDKINCLNCTRQHLKENGYILIDNYNPSIPYLNTPLGETMSSSKVTLADGRRVQRTDTVTHRDFVRQIQECEIRFDVTYPDGEHERTIIPYQTSYLFRFELEHLLARTGFEVLDVYGGYDRSPFGTNYPGELIALARVR